MSVLRVAHQFSPTMAYGDAVSNDAFELQRLLWSWQVRSDLFAEDAKPRVRAFVRQFPELLKLRRRDSALLIHLAMGNAAYDELLDLPLRKVLVYHNITPAEYFAGLNPSHEEWARRGREQLARLARVCELGIGDSEYNRKELEAAGFARTSVVPILVDWSGFDVEPDADVERRLARERAILFVGQLAPQKAPHDLIAGFARYRESDGDARLYLVGSTADSGAYLERLRSDVARLGLQDAVTFAGAVSMPELVAYYRGAKAFATMSDHEGFCVPLLEAMRFELPVVANAGGAIPDTLGRAGIVLERKTPDDVAGALERALGDTRLRGELAAAARERLAEFSRERVGQRLADAFGAIGATFPRSRSLKVAVLSSAADDGIRPYGLAVRGGLAANGHDARYVGVRVADTADLLRTVRELPPGTEVVVVEHEFGLFRDVSFIRALLSLWRRGVAVVLSFHEIEPDKFHHYRKVRTALHYRQTYAWPLEALRIPWVALVLGFRFFLYRLFASLLGALPQRLVIHSDRSKFWVDLITSNRDKVEEAPLVTRPLEGFAQPLGPEEKRRLRERLGLPRDAFIFVSPGFFFRRKRFLEVIAAAGRDAVVVLSGTASSFEPAYVDEVRQFVAEHGYGKVVINTEWATMSEHVAASDCVVLYYENIFQSGVATQAIWAGLPCIFSDLPGFRVYEGAGLFARDTEELRERMREIQRPEVYARLRKGIAFYQRMLAPERQAPRLVAGLALPERR
jgi:glycosyltransferase involved in cell wall biosynthesis